jgi:hypothetical protein
MKRLIVCSLIGLLGGSAAYAQNIRIAPEVGLNLSGVVNRINDDTRSYDLRPGLRAGGVLDIGLSRYVSFQPGLFYSQKGAKQEYTDVIREGNLSSEYEFNRTLALSYLEAPFNLQVHLGPRHRPHFFFGAGPYIAYTLSGRETIERQRVITAGNTTVASATTDEYELNIGNNAPVDDLKQWDAGLNLNAGFAGRHAYLRGQAGIGLMNVIPGGDENHTMRNWHLGISLGYMLP